MLKINNQIRYRRPSDANALRKRISVNEEGKPVLKENSTQISPSNFKP